jgi:hypothetical protein
MPHLARRTSHLHPICATESAAPPQEDSSLGQQLAPLAPEQRSTAQHSAAKRSVSWWCGGGSLARLRMRALHQANGTPSSDD